MDMVVGSAEKAALEYAARGWPVFPCNPVNKQPLTKKGFYDATTDTETIHKMWAKNPVAMIGVPTGDPIAAFVLDINPPKGLGLFGARMLIEQVCGDGCTDTMVTETPNGLHLWYKLPRDAVVRNRGSMLGGAIDCVRGTGGYVIVAPSVNADGGVYKWLTGLEKLKTANKSMLQLVRPQV